MSGHPPPTASAPNPSTAQARVLVDELARGGLRDAVVCPGSRSTALAIALHEDPRVRAHVHPDERAAAFVALGIARASGRPAAVLVTSGTAVANLHPAVLEAHHDRIPLLLLTADRPPELRATGANQTTDQVGLFGGAVRMSIDLGVAEDRDDAVRTWRATAARCLAEAAGLGGPPGPVQLNVPFREPTLPVADDGRSSASPTLSALAGRGAFAPWVAVDRAPRVPGPALLDELAGLVAATERGLIAVAGDAAIDPATVDAAAAATGWPVIAEGHSPARRGTAALRAAPWLVEDPAFAEACRPELVLRIGRPTVAPHPGLGGPGATEILVDAEGAWADPSRTTSRLVVAEPSDLLAGLAHRLPVAAGSDWADAWRAADVAAASAIDDAVRRGDAPRELATMRAVLAGQPSSVPLHVGSSGPIRDLDRCAAAPPFPVIHANRGVSGIDGTVSTALGLALAAGRATAVVGDLSLLHDLGSLLLRPDSPPPGLTLVVLANGGGALFDRLPAAQHAPAFERLFITPHGLVLGEVVRALGVEHRRVERTEDLSSLLAETPEGIRVLEVQVDRSDEVRRRRALSDTVRAAIRGRVRE